MSSDAHVFLVEVPRGALIAFVKALPDGVQLVEAEGLGVRIAEADARHEQASAKAVLAIMRAGAQDYMWTTEEIAEALVDGGRYKPGTAAPRRCLPCAPRCSSSVSASAATSLGA